MLVDYIKRKTINIDFPYFHGSNLRSDGSVATSFVTNKELIDRAIGIGFNSISFDVDIPIDPSSGRLYFLNYDPANGQNDDNRITDEVWRSIEYAESRGLATQLSLNIRNIQPHAFTSLSNVEEGFSTSEFFNSVETYETEIAEKAQSFGVDTIGIAEYNNDLTSEVYASEWRSVVNSIRDVFDGQLLYSSNIQNIDSPIWDMVDVIQVMVNPTFRLESDLKASDFVNMYMEPFWASEDRQSELSTFEYLQAFVAQYPNKTLSVITRTEPGKSPGYEFDDIWAARDRGVPIPDEQIDFQLNKMKVEGFLEFFGNYLADDFDGMEYWQYMPWTEGDSWRNAEEYGADALVWKSVIEAGSALNYNPEAEQSLGKYLTKPWGFHTLHYGTVENDVLVGTSDDDTFFTSSGSDRFDGGGGVDRVVFEVVRPLIDYSTKAVSIDGHTFSNIERLAFDDVSIAIDLNGSAGQTAKTLAAIFGVESLSDKQSVGIGLQLFDAGYSLATVCELALNAVGNMTHDDVVNTLYTNLFGEAPSNKQRQEYVDWLDQGIVTKGELAAAVAELTADLEIIDLVGLAKTGIEYV